MDVKLPYKFIPRPWQVDEWNRALDPEFKRGMTIVPRRNGKDLTYWNICIAKAMHRKGLYFYLGPYYNQIRQIIWEGSDSTGRKFLDYIPPEIIKGKPTKLDMRINLVNGSQIKLCGSDNIDSIVGTNPVGIVFTEFPLQNPEAWDYLRPILAENGGWAMFNGTPRGLNHAYKLFHLAKKDPLWHTTYLTRDDTGVPTLEAIEQDRQSGMPESLIQQEYYCAWTASQESVLIPLDIIDPAYHRTITLENYEYAPRVMGCDVAYAVKGDKATIAKRQGRFLHPIKSFQGLNNMAFASKIAEEINQWRPDAVFIDNGRGEGVISRLIQLGYHNQIMPVYFNAKPYSDLYLNKRAEMWCRCRDWFLKDKPVIPHDDTLAQELSTYKFFPNDRGYIQLESKAQMKTRLHLESTDFADSLVLTFAEEMVEKEPKTPEERLLKQLLQQRMDDQIDAYNPLGHYNADDSDYEKYFGHLH